MCIDNMGRMTGLKPVLKSSHLRDIGQSWSTHFVQASVLSGISFIGSLKCMVHAVFPDIFITCGQDTVNKMQDRLNTGYKPVSTSER